MGAELCSELVAAGHEVTVLDNNSRGHPRRLKSLKGDIEIVDGDVRDPECVRRAMRHCDTVWHLAYINGTRHFYEQPDLVLDVGIRGTLNTIEAAMELGVRRYILASTSETYNTPTHVPTDESERLMVPDVTNPRFSYGGGKIACELLTLHMAAWRGLETVIFRPHNFIGPDMGFEHVIPELTRKMVEASNGLKARDITIEIQGSGEETRAFCDIRDGARGAFLAGEFGAPGEIYHVGTQHEVSIRELVAQMGQALELNVTVKPGTPAKGGTSRRCPSIEKLSGLGYQPAVSFEEAVRRTTRWYADHFVQQSGS